MPRHKYFLTLVKNIPNHKVKNIVINLIDPNSIRKLRRINPTQINKSENLKFYFDIRYK